MAVNLDMVGRLGDRGLKVYGTRTSAGLRQVVSWENSSPALTLHFPWESLDDSDHFSFFERHIPYLMFHTGLHDDYHRPSDDADKVNAEGMRQITRLVANVVLQLADRPGPAAFRHAARGEDGLAQEQFERALPPPQPRVGIRWQPPSEEGTGLVVTSVIVGSAAERGGLRVGDRLLSFAGQDIVASDDLVDQVLRAASPVPVVVQRPGASEPLQLQLQLPGKPTQLGVSWRDDDAEPASVYLTRVIDDSPADHAGLRPGDRLYEVSGLRVFRQRRVSTTGNHSVMAIGADRGARRPAALGDGRRADRRRSGPAWADGPGDLNEVARFREPPAPAREGRSRSLSPRNSRRWFSLWKCYSPILTVYRLSDKTSHPWACFAIRGEEARSKGVFA